MTSWFQHHKHDQPTPADAQRHSLYDEPGDVIHESWLAKDDENPFYHTHHTLAQSQHEAPEDGVLASMAALCAVSSLVSVMQQLESTTPHNAQ